MTKLSKKEIKRKEVIKRLQLLLLKGENLLFRINQQIEKLEQLMERKLPINQEDQ